MTARPVLVVDTRPLEMPEGPPPPPGAGLPGSDAAGAPGAAPPEPAHDLSDWCVTAVTWGGGWVADLTGDPTMRASRFELTTVRAVTRKLEERGLLTIPDGFTTRRVLVIAALLLVGVMVLVRVVRMGRRRRAQAPAPDPDAPPADAPMPTAGSAPVRPIRTGHLAGDGYST